MRTKAKAKIIPRRLAPRIHPDNVGIFTYPLLADHPYFEPLFRKFGIPEHMVQMVLISSVQETFGELFAAKLSFHAHGQIRQDLQTLKRPIVPAASNPIAGFMARYGKNLDRYLVALTAGLPGFADLQNAVNVGTLVHEYGHYAEELHAFELRRAGFSPALSSFGPAFKWIRKYCSDLQPQAHAGDETELVTAAFEIAAWTNAIWLCWLFSIDPRQVVLGVALDGLSSPFMRRFAEVGLPQLQGAITNRHEAQNRILLGEFDGKLKGFFRQGNEKTRCMQIDKASFWLLTEL